MWRSWAGAVNLKRKKKSKCDRQTEGRRDGQTEGWTDRLKELLIGPRVWNIIGPQAGSSREGS